MAHALITSLLPIFTVATMAFFFITTLSKSVHCTNEKKSLTLRHVNDGKFTLNNALLDRPNFHFYKFSHQLLKDKFFAVDIIANDYPKEQLRLAMLDKANDDLLRKMVEFNSWNYEEIATAKTDRKDPCRHSFPDNAYDSLKFKKDGLLYVQDGYGMYSPECFVFFNGSKKFLLFKRIIREWTCVGREYDCLHRYPLVLVVPNPKCAYQNEGMQYGERLLEYREF